MGICIWDSKTRYAIPKKGTWKQVSFSLWWILNIVGSIQFYPSNWVVFRNEMKKNCIEIRILQENYLPACWLQGRQVFRYIFAVANFCCWKFPLRCLHVTYFEIYEFSSSKVLKKNINFASCLNFAYNFFRDSSYKLFLLLNISTFQKVINPPWISFLWNTQDI